MREKTKDPEDFKDTRDRGSGVLLVFGVLLVLSGALAAQEPERRDPLGTRLVNVATPFPVQEKTLEVVFLHRFHLPIQDGSSSDLWGLDSGADVGIGLAWGITSRLDASLLRFSFQEDFELAGKFLMMEQKSEQKPGRPVSLAVRAGVDRLEREGIEDPTRPFAQVLLSRRLGKGFNLLLSPSWVRDTPRLRNAFNVPVGLTFALAGGSLVELEVIPENRDLDGSVTAWHLAWSRDVGGHIFEIVLGNSRAVTVDQYLGGDSAAGFEAEDVRLGFNLIRDFDFSF